MKNISLHKQSEPYWAYENKTMLIFQKMELDFSPYSTLLTQYGQWFTPNGMHPSQSDIVRIIRCLCKTSQNTVTLYFFNGCQ